MQKKSKGILLANTIWILAVTLSTSFMQWNNIAAKNVQLPYEKNSRDDKKEPTNKPNYRDLKGIDIAEISEFHLLRSYDAKRNEEIYFLKYSDKMMIIRYCTGEIIFDNILEFQTQYETGVFKTSDRWILIDNRVSNYHVWRPHLVPIDEFDKIVLLKNNDLLLKKNNKSWYGRIYVDKNNKTILEKVLIPELSSEIFEFGSGFLAQVLEKNSLYWRYFELKGKFSDKEKNIVHQKNTSIQFNPNFKADSIVSTENYTYTILYKFQGKNYYYSPRRDNILASGFDEYYIEDGFFKRLVIKEGNSVSFYTNKLSKLNFEDLSAVYLKPRSGDLFTGYIATKDNKEYTVYFSYQEIADSIFISEKTKNILQFEPPYSSKLFNRDSSGNLYFIDYTKKIMVVQSTDGSVVQTKKLDHIERKNGFTILATKDHWEVYPNGYYGRPRYYKQYNRSVYDSFQSLEYSGFLAKKDKRTYFINCAYDNNGNRVLLEPVQIQSFLKEFIEAGGSFLINVSQMANTKKFKLLIDDEKLLQLHPEGISKKGVNRDIDIYYPGFEADSILFTPNQLGHHTFVYRQGGQIKILNKYNKQIYSPRNNEFWMSPPHNLTQFEGNLVFLSNDTLYIEGNTTKRVKVPGAIGFTARHIGHGTFASVEFSDGRKETIALIGNNCSR